MTLSTKTRPLLHVKGLGVTYEGPAPVTALRGVDLDVFPGEFLVIEGPSGGGKSTLLNVLGLLQSPTRGRYRVEGVDTGSLSQREITRLRASHFSFVFQSFHMLQGRPALDSVALGLQYAAVPSQEVADRSARSLEAVSMAAAASQDASTLSGGQQQRVAIARALAADTPVLIADEPTGNLDSANSEQVLDVLMALRDAGIAVVVATHEQSVAERADRRVRVEDGKVVSDTRSNLARRQAPPVRNQPRPAGEATSGRWAGAWRRLGSAVRDATASVRSRRSRSAALVIAVAVAVGLAVGTYGLATTSSGQVSDQFNARENRYVTVEGPVDGPAEAVTTGWDAPSTEHVVERLLGVSGVESAVIVNELGHADVSASPRSESIQLPIAIAVGDLVAATDSTVRWSRGESLAAGPRVLVGTYAAANLDLGPIDAMSYVWIGGKPYVVAGLIEDSARAPRLGGMVVVLGDDSLSASAESQTTLVKTRAGAAPSVGRQAPLVIDPVHPETLRVSVPVDPRDLRQVVERSVAVSLAVLSLVALIAAVLALGNAMTLAVASRRSEFGLRRAVGAAPRDLARLVLLEAGVIGVAGGLLGLVVGYLAVFAVTIANHWTPVMDPRTVPLALVGGVVVGALAGIAAARQAAKVDPALALRM